MKLDPGAIVSSYDSGYIRHNVKNSIYFTIKFTYESLVFQNFENWSSEHHESLQYLFLDN